MFVSGIKISDHNQFKDFKLDLTYPKGHKKEGQPLDKVCFIGQSGTGKTTLLEEILVMNTGRVPEYRSTGSIDSEEMTITSNGHFEYTVLFDNYYEKTNYSKVAPEQDNPFSLYYGAEFESKKYNILRFGLDNFEPDKRNGWGKIIENIKEYQDKKIQYHISISKAYMANKIEEAEQKVSELKALEKSSILIVGELAAKYLDAILGSFNMKVKTDFHEMAKIDRIYLLNKTTGYYIPMEGWSSGVKNLIARTIPLYTHQFKNAIICVDEPENSLYPDVQRKIIDIYTQLAPDSQFFFATHSPIIASSFEPWEIVELKFNEEGYVYRELYYEGDNHVDNYKYYPQYLRWDAILQNIFDLENDGSEERQELLQEFSNLDTQLKARKAKGEQLTKEDPDVQKLMEMGKKLGWNTKQG